MSAMFAQLARYNRWANARLYEAALALDEGIYRGDVGAFFKSMHGTSQPPPGHRQDLADAPDGRGPFTQST